MEDTNLQKPCFVSTTQGFSVSYKNKLLYSKYNPSKLILQTIAGLQIQPGTIFLCNSPALLYGLQELLEKLPPQCLLVGCEFDKELHDFTSQILKQKEYRNIIQNENFCFPSLQEVYNLPVIFNQSNYVFSDGKVFNSAGYYRRVISLDFSAGTSFYQDLYNQLQKACQSSLMTFWANRVTLTKFGRKYSSHFLQNLKNYCTSTPIENYFYSVEKPIIVFGAGESIDKGIAEIKTDRKNYFILCTDTSLTSLLEAGIEPEGVFVEEAQQVISKAFIGTKNYNYQIFAGLSSLPQLAHNFGTERISYFATEYTNANFIDKLKNEDLLPPENNPFGSVGLTTVYYALKFRKDESVPVFLYGLDFSYSAGKTHGKGTMAHKTRVNSTTRLNPVQNYGAAFNNTTFHISDKQNKTFYTTQILSNYANLFNSLFTSTNNLFDSGDSGIKLNLPFAKPSVNTNKRDRVNCNSSETAYNGDRVNHISPTKASQIQAYLSDEAEALSLLRDILSGVKKLSPEEAEKQITELCLHREYLYLHFPDGWKFSSELSFLKRIRSEIDYFLKILK
ncbi:MAG: DUF115 domain-containing protein [Treponema sp.]|nr:DUF115 domain-containing protein [Treponema sp.]